MKGIVNVISILLLTLVAGLSGTAPAFGHPEREKEVGCDHREGVVLIDQEKALHGGVTAGDRPGFPVTIRCSGSYRLSGNLAVPDGNTTAILIQASNVALDLNGFSILGRTNGRGSGTGNGIEASGSDIWIHNGTVQGMGRDGIRFNAYPSQHIRIEQILASANGHGGINLSTSSGNMVTGNKATFNGTFGISAGFDSRVDHNVTNYNVGNGIEIGSGKALGNVCDWNRGYGLVAGSGVVGLLFNSFMDNSQGSVSGGVIMGPNVCGTALCP